MKGVQISPWSIYNEKTSNHIQQIHNQTKLVLPSIKQTKTHQQRLVKKKIEITKQYSQIASPQQSIQRSCSPLQKSIEITQKINSDRQEDTIWKQKKQVQKMIEQRLILQIIWQSIKTEMAVDRKDDETCKYQQICLKFPKMNIQKYMAAMGLQDKSSSLEAKIINKQKSPQAIKLMIKNQIKSRIKAKMIIMGKTKDISNKK